MDRAAAVHELAFVVERLAAAAVDALVRAAIDVAVRDPAPDELLDALLVILIDRRTDVAVVRDEIDVAHPLELAGVAIHERARGDQHFRQHRLGLIDRHARLDPLVVEH